MFACVVGLAGIAGCGATDDSSPLSPVAPPDGASDAAPRGDGGGASHDGRAAPDGQTGGGGPGGEGDAAAAGDASRPSPPGDASGGGDDATGGGGDDGPSPPPGGDGGGSPPDAALSPRDELLGFLRAISGKKTLSGEHNRESSQGDFIQAMHDVTGHYPALWGGDFLFEPDQIQNRPNVIRHLMDGWKGGAVIDLMYHACPPTQDEACGWDGGVLSTLSDDQWSDLVTEGGSLNQTWKSRLDSIAPYFQQLRDAGMAALFRPHHEMNQGVFWWAGRKGPGGTAKLYQITHDYLVKTKGLDNIVWVWSVQDIWDNDTNSWNFDAYDPGDAYWDVMSLDFYDGKGYTTDKYDAMLAVAGDKPVAIGECQVLPTPGELGAQPRWVYFMGWAELVQQNQSSAAIAATYTASDVLTQDTMPGW